MVRINAELQLRLRSCWRVPWNCQRLWDLTAIGAGDMVTMCEGKFTFVRFGFGWQDCAAAASAIHMAIGGIFPIATSLIRAHHRKVFLRSCSC